MASSLRDEIQQSRPFPSIETEVLLNLLRTADHVASEQAAVLKPHELSASAYNVLRILRGAGDGGLPSSAIGVRMITRVPDVTRLVDRLVARGLVGRCRGETDRRVVRVFLEPAGAQLLEQLEQPVEELALRLFAPLGKDRLLALCELLVAVRHVGAPPGD